MAPGYNRMLVSSMLIRSNLLSGATSAEYLLNHCQAAVA